MINLKTSSLKIILAVIGGLCLIIGVVGIFVVIALQTSANQANDIRLLPTVEKIESTTRPSVAPSTSSADATIYEFSLKTASQVVSADILEEVFYYGGQGGGGGECYEEGALINKLTLGYRLEVEKELIEALSVVICGAIPGETLDITIDYPDGTQRQLSEQVSTEFGFEFSFTPLLDDPAGTYFFEIQGQTGKVQFDQVFRKSSGPRIYRVEDFWIFHNFIPGEQIQVIAFQVSRVEMETNHPKCTQEWDWDKCEVWEPVLQQEFRINSRGELRLKSEQEYLAAISENTGFTSLFRAGDTGGVYCPNIPSRQEILPDDMVVVIDENAWVINRSGDKSYIPKGTMLKIKGNIVFDESAELLCQQTGKPGINYLAFSCEPGMTFCDVDSEMFIPEGIGNRYFIQPVGN
jgi:hypothetical protein